MQDLQCRGHLRARVFLHCTWWNKVPILMAVVLPIIVCAVRQINSAWLGLSLVMSTDNLGEVERHF